MANDERSNSAALDEELIAYLDGELTPEAERRIEELLSADTGVRKRLQALERTWNLLDDLDSVPVGGQFTQTTLEMVAVAAGRDLERETADAPRRLRRNGLMILVGALLAALLGFGSVWLLRPDPDRQLLQDLTVLENLDEYDQVDNVEFLRMLRKAGLFDEPDDDVSLPPIIKNELSSQRRARIEAMTPSQKLQLQQLEERFAAFDEEHQDRLRQLDASMLADPDASVLRRVLHDYCEWLTTLPSFTRAELAEMEPAARVTSIKKRIQDEIARSGGRKLGRKDAEALMKWARELVVKHEKQLISALPSSELGRISDATPQMRHRMLFWQLWQRWQSAVALKTTPPVLTDADLSDLRAELSADVRKRMASKPPVDQWRMAAGWVRSTLQRQTFARGFHGPLSEAEDARLADFFENDLTDREREQLLSLPGEEMQRALQRLYQTKNKLPEAPARGKKHPAGSDKHSSESVKRAGASSGK